MWAESGHVPCEGEARLIPGGGNTMHMTRTSACLLGAALAVALAGCGPEENTAASASASASGSPAASPTVAAPSAPVSAGASTPAGAAKPTSAGTAKALPNLVGQGLQSAQDAAQAAGFYNLASSDALGRDRMQIDDRNWKVCFQSPAAGQADSSAKVTFSAVKLDETCPASPQNPGVAGVAPGGTVPNVVGKSANVAVAAFPSNASIRTKDASGSDRMVLVASNWQVCTQDPAAGATFSGQPVTLGVVKFGESCPRG